MSSWHPPTRVAEKGVIFGKWACGATQQTDNTATINAPGALPNVHGFDQFYGYLNQTAAHYYFPQYLWPADAGAPSGVSLVATGNTTSDPYHAYSHDTFADMSVQYVRNHAHDAEPFFLHTCFTIPHFNYTDIANAPGGYGQYASMPWTDTQKQYAAMITRMDASIGRMMQALDDPNGDDDTSDSIARNTLVVFTSDNGATMENNSPINFFQSNGDLRGGKRDLYEGGIHVPMVLRWTDTIAAGTTNSRVMDQCDFLPTLAELAGAETPVGLDGVSLAPTITGQGNQWARDYLIYEFHEDSAGPAGGTPARWAIRRGDYKLIKFKDGKRSPSFFRCFWPALRPKLGARRC